MVARVDVATENDPVKISINNHPDIYPICSRDIDARFKFGYSVDYDIAIELVYQCPRHDCHAFFIAQYSPGFDREGNLTEVFELSKLVPQEHQNRKFSEQITSTSTDFVRIYNQAQQAEELSLADIAGPGYRKALEFLIKDYSILNNPEVSETIKHKHLSNVINDYVVDTNIKSTAKRAAWLGNDETHYYRKWEDKDMKDLKILIELTVRWIESELLTREYEKSMSD